MGHGLRLRLRGFGLGIGRPIVPRLHHASASPARRPCYCLLGKRDGGEEEDEVLDPEEASALLPPLLLKEEKRMSQDHHELIAAAASLFLGEKIGGKFDSRVKKSEWSGWHSEVVLVLVCVIFFLLTVGGTGGFALLIKYAIQT